MLLEWFVVSVLSLCCCNAPDLGAIKATYEPMIFGEDSNEKAAAPETRTIIREVYKGPEPPLVQAAFQPSSTPTHLQHRFMVGQPLASCKLAVVKTFIGERKKWNASRATSFRYHFYTAPLRGTISCESFFVSPSTSMKLFCKMLPAQPYS